MRVYVCSWVWYQPCEIDQIQVGELDDGSALNPPYVGFTFDDQPIEAV